MASDRNVFSWFRRIAYIAFACLFLLAQPQHLFGQVDAGAIDGAVQDSSGASVPNAHVTLLNTDQGITLETTTGGNGEYVFSPVRIGHYTLTVTAPGFSTTTQQNLTVTVGQHLNVNVKLSLGAASQTVQVTAAPPQLQTDEASVGQVVNQRTLNSLPLNGRNFTFLAQSAAGVNTPQADTRGNAASGAFSANGLRPAQNNYLLDGIDNNSNAVDFLNGTNFVILPPLDAIQEFKVQTADFSAELGRSAGAVLNATIKSGTNSIHGAVWEFFRNDKLDAADWFEDNAGITKGKLRQNQFGASIGGPIIKDKLFYFGDYEGFRRVQGTVLTGSVPSLTERNSGFTDLSDLISKQSGPVRTDAVGRKIPYGTVLDPATTRAVKVNTLDPVSGRLATQNGFVRDPFGSCGPSTPIYTPAGCGLNQLPATRLDANAVKLLNLYPVPTNGGFTNNFTNSPALYEHKNAYDIRVDFNPSPKDQVFGRFSYADDPQFIPGIFGGIADGGGFQQGIQTYKSNQSVIGYTHVFTPTTINVARVGFNHLHTTRFGPEGNTEGIPAQFGIQGVPQSSENGGLPAIQIAGLNELGSNDFLPSDEISQTLQITDDFTKIYGKNTFKMGMEYQSVNFNTLQPAFSRGQFNFDGNYAGVPSQSGDQTGRAAMLLVPTNATVPGGINGIGGANQVQASNISKTYDQRSYLAVYFQDDIKLTPVFTLNLGLRWDYFSPISETNGGQANFVQDGPPTGGPIYLIPATGKDDRHLSSTANNPSLNGKGFLDLLAKDGIALGSTNKYGNALVQTQQTNFAPRAGFAYQASPKLVARGGIGLFFNSFENQGYGPNIGENYPFVYNFNFQTNGSDSAPFGAGPNPYSTCGTAGVGGSAPIGTGLSCAAFTPLAVNAAGLSLQGLQFNYQTPRTLSSNLSLQYSLTNTLSAQASYVFTDGSDLQQGIGNNRVSQLVAANTSTTPYVPFPDFSQGASYQRTIGSSIYNGLQTKLEQQLSNGLSYLFTYTFSKTLSDSGDLLNGSPNEGIRAPYVPGAGPRFDWGLADFDIRHVFHISGTYELPVGANKKYLANIGKLGNQVVGGWSVNWLTTLQGGQPITLSCPSGTTSGTNCIDVKVPGQSQKLGLKTRTASDGKINLFWFGNPAAFNQPCQLGDNGQLVTPLTPTGCVPQAGLAILGGRPAISYGPGFHRLDFSAFKGFQISDRISMQFRAEFFNILNHPNFNAPNFGGNGVSAIGGSGDFTNAAFGQIGSTRDAPYDPRQIQFALKLYY
jgi:Carboxypeptidase regulatory-like domain/TonB-dependent Receptor Plug Domain